MEDFTSTYLREGIATSKIITFKTCDTLCHTEVMSFDTQHQVHNYSSKLQ